MTRMWMLNPKKMCRQHLLGEHKELHQLVGLINKGKLASIGGHARKGQVDTSKIQERHEQLVKEMTRRKMRHDSPLPTYSCAPIGCIDEEANLHDLCSRCEECAKGFKYVPPETPYHPPATDGKVELPEHAKEMARSVVPRYSPDIPMKWYALVTAPNQEKKARMSLFHKAFEEDAEHLLGRVLSPSEKVVEVKNGKRTVTLQRKMPGYLLVEMMWCDNAYYLFRDLDGGLGLIGWPNPHALKDEEVNRLLDSEQKVMADPTSEADASRRKHVIPYNVGEEVEVKHGAYKGVVGKVKHIDEDPPLGGDPRVTIVIQVLGTPADVELNHWEVSKA